jgi:hypothetical protein
MNYYQDSSHVLELTSLKNLLLLLCYLSEELLALGKAGKILDVRLKDINYKPKTININSEIIYLHL